jgi:hypothetical protein
MANMIVVMGKTGTGKSRSMKNLDPTKTYLINCLGKDLPFRTGRADYKPEKNNYKEVNQWDEVIKTIQRIVEKRPEVNTIVIDDARYIMETEFIARANEGGYTKYTVLGQHMIAVLETARTISNKELNIYMMLHTDDVANGNTIFTYKPKLVGQLVENHFDPIELVTICLLTEVKISQKDTEYSFITNRTNINGVIIPAKSPEEMFPLSIENDLALVNKYIHDYYKEEGVQ